VNESARDILERLEGKDEADGQRKVVAFLQGALKERGPRMAAEVIAEGEGAGLGKDAMRRALKKLGGRTEKASMNTGWLWGITRLSGMGDARKLPKAALFPDPHLRCLRQWTCHLRRTRRTRKLPPVRARGRRRFRATSRFSPPRPTVAVRWICSVTMVRDRSVSE
jgi:hypothetical protein